MFLCHLILSKLLFVFLCMYKLVHSFTLEKLSTVGDVLCVPAVHSPPVTHWPVTSPAVGWASLQLCLWAQFHRLWGCIFFASGFCSLVGEVGLEICGGRGSSPHTGWCWSLTFRWWVGLCSCTLGGFGLSPCSTGIYRLFGGTRSWC